MTFEEFARKYLTDRGMSEGEAAEVLEAAKATKAGAIMADRWGDDVSGYAETFKEIVAALLDVQALKWIDENSPESVFRPLFESEAEQ